MRQKGGTNVTNRKNTKKRFPIILAILIILILISVPIIILVFSGKISLGLLEKVADQITNDPQPIYSNLTGLEIADSSVNTTPTFCMQIPNGSTDGARPQFGLNQAAIIYEAIAETGITRFAAVFQNPELSMIGPIRSLRPYYLDWDTPYDCTVVHDGGSDEALAAVGNGEYRNLDEDFSYMWKVDYVQGQYRFWNNVFTSSAKLAQFNQTHQYTTSHPKTFPRLMPDAVTDLLASQEACTANPECTADTNRVNNLTITFNGLTDYIVQYHYDRETNSYLRSYGNGEQHMSYYCPANLSNPPEGCELQPVASKVVIAMHVQEHAMSDNYHESIKTLGSGSAEIFQNGEVISGTWEKPDTKSQVTFRDNNGEIIKLTPGLVWIEAIPQFGSSSY